jgi:hypothetical protein
MSFRTVKKRTYSHQDCVHIVSQVEKNDSWWELEQWDARVCIGRLPKSQQHKSGAVFCVPSCVSADADRQCVDRGGGAGVGADTCFQIPMYIFLELLITSVIIPKILSNFLSGKHTLSFAACIT